MTRTRVGRGDHLLVVEGVLKGRCNAHQAILVTILDEVLHRHGDVEGAKGRGAGMAPRNLTELVGEELVLDLRDHLALRVKDLEGRLVLVELRAALRAVEMD